MRSQLLPVVSAAALGFAAAAVTFSLGVHRPAEAQFRGAPPLGQIPTVLPGGSNTGASATTTPQPLEIQSLDGEHFVVATREPRLVQQVGREGTAQNMLVTVVTHYTVRGDKLIPVEHVRVPTGYRAITIEE